jgi:hypothetical protein
MSESDEQEVIVLDEVDLEVHEIETRIANTDALPGRNY